MRAQRDSARLAICGLASILALLSGRAYAAAPPVLQLPCPQGTTHNISGGFTYCPGCLFSTHKGLDSYAIDFALPDYSTVTATAAGVLHRYGLNAQGACCLDGYGYLVWIDHQNGYMTLYAHLHDFSSTPADGAFVNPNDTIGISGGSPYWAPHLHFAMHQASSMFTGITAVPEPMSAYTDFGNYGYGDCTDSTFANCALKPGGATSPPGTYLAQAATATNGSPQSSEVVSWAANRVDYFVKGSNGDVMHRWAANATTAPAWEDMGQATSGDPQAVSWAANRLDVFTRGPDGTLKYNWWDQTSWGGWQTPVAGSALVSDPVAVAWGSNRLDVFMLGTDRAMYHYWYDGISWNTESLGGYFIGTPAAVSWARNRIDVFAVNAADRSLQHRALVGGAWQPSGGFESLGGALSATAKLGVVSWGPNRVDVFAVGSASDNTIYHTWYGGSSWNGWETMAGASPTGASTVSWAANRIDILVQSTDSKPVLYVNSWNGFGWSGWAALGGTPSVGSFPYADTWGVGRIDALYQSLPSLGRYHEFFQSGSWYGQDLGAA